jgi:Cu2+-exporting ATPase/Cu+-exporting ATPase
MSNQNYKIIGMHCVSCANIIEQELTKFPAINTATVNFATETANIDFNDPTLSLAEINTSLQPFGYTLKSGETTNPETKAHSEDPNPNNSALFAFPLALFIFLIMLWEILAKLVWSIPNPPFSMEAWTRLNLILASLILFSSGQRFIKGLVLFVRSGNANMDSLVGLGTVTAYGYSLIITLFPEIPLTLKLPTYTYFDVTIVVIGFVLFGKYLESTSKAKTSEAIKKLLGLQAKTAILWHNGQEHIVAIETIQPGHILIVKPGDKIPVDGKIIEGFTSIDESMITGEAIPVDKTIHQNVIGGTLNLNGYIKFTASKVGKDTLLSKIIQLVETAQNSKAPIQHLADKISYYFVPTVLIIAFITFALWLILGSQWLNFNQAFAFGLVAFVSVLIIACPCALGLATPTAIIAGVGKGAQNGILIKNAETLQKLNRINTVVLDKTGTLTLGKPQFKEIIIINPAWTQEQILQYSASLENLSNHPLAEPIVKQAQTQKLTLLKVTDFKQMPGIGVTGKINEHTVQIRKPIASDHSDRIQALQHQGKTVMIVEVDSQIIGLLTVSDELKPTAKTVITQLKNLNIETIILTGDNQLTAQAIATEVGIKNVIAEILPQDKAEKIKALQHQGKKVAMLGDGINDAPALIQADVGIAMATGSDIAIESADITLLHGDLTKLLKAFKLSKLTLQIIKQNLFWAFIYNIIGIPVASGLLYPLLGWTLSPIFAGLAMAFSSVSVVANALRLKSFKL